MNWIRGVVTVGLASGLAAGTFAGATGTVPKSKGRAEIEAFNKQYVEMHLKMDTAGILATWAQDGVDLMPGQEPMVGKKVIEDWVEGILNGMQDYKVIKEEVEFHDIRVWGSWATEWATEHQVVQPPGGKPVIESRGKMALVLHREANGKWKVKQEMWNQAAKK